MASYKGAVASGADFDAQATRRRNVPSTSPNGGLTDRVEIDEKKTQAKEVSSLFLLRTNFLAMKAFKG
jgi:dolichyl-phosphate-mannose-protein mannosyltransferase